jgi:hypothetical protein
MSKGVSDLDKSNQDFVNALVYDEVTAGHTAVNKRDVEEEIEYEHPEIPDFHETWVTAVLLPIVIFGGFGRNVTISEKRSTLLLLAHAQEILLHTFPLGLILILNFRELKKVTILDFISISLLAANIFEIFLEMCVLKLYENVKINLELRNAMKSANRTIDLFKVSIVSILFLAAGVLLAILAVPQGECIRGQFMENNMCKMCKTYVDPFCVSCTSRFACDECLDGYFGVDKDCIPCKERFGDQCEECTAGGCTKCKPENFIRYGQCVNCRFMPGCASDQCFEDGCH